MPADVELIAFVTRAYPRMRATIIAAPFAPFVILLAQNFREGDVPGIFGAVVLLLIAAPLSVHVIGRRLDRRFGKVILSSAPTLWQAFAPMLGGALFAFVYKLDEWSLRSGSPSVLMLVLAGCGLWMTVRDWPFRKHLLVFAGVCAASAAWLGAMSHSPDLLRWRTRADATAVLAWISVGFFDLRVLRRVMPKTDGVRERSGT